MRNQYIDYWAQLIRESEEDYQTDCNSSIADESVKISKGRKIIDDESNEEMVKNVLRYNVMVMMDHITEKLNSIDLGYHGSQYTEYMRNVIVNGRTIKWDSIVPKDAGIRGNAHIELYIAANLMGQSPTSLRTREIVWILNIWSHKYITHDELVKEFDIENAYNKIKLDMSPHSDFYSKKTVNTVSAFFPSGTDITIDIKHLGTLNIKCKTDYFITNDATGTIFDTTPMADRKTEYHTPNLPRESCKNETEVEEYSESQSKERSGIGNVIVEFNTPCENGIKKIQKSMSSDEFETWIKKIGEESQLQDIYLELASKDATSIRLKPIDVRISHN